ncbi:MAG: apolipoprotein N-acyltransferase [Nocardioides sp.]
MLVRSLVAAAAGVLLALAFEPVGWALLIPLCVAGFVWSVRGLSARAAVLPGLLFGVGFQFVLLWWMRAVGTDAYLAISAVEAAFFGILGPLTAVVTRWRGWPIWAAAAWLGVEVWRSSWPFSGMPWGRLSFASADIPVAGAMPYLSANGVSLLLALLGTGLLWAALQIRARPIQGTLAIAPLVALVAVPVVTPYHLRPEGTIQVAAVQGNVPGDGSDILLDHRQVTRNLRDATVELAHRIAAGTAPRPDFVLWPENSTAVDPFTDATVNATIQEASRAIGLPILVGGMVRAPDPGQVMNQGIVWDPVTGPGDRYTKRHPVPFGEYIPWRDKVFPSNFGKLREIPYDMLSGTRKAPLHIGGVLVADSICFDVAYDDGLYDQVAGGAQLLVQQTSNALYVYTVQPDQQFEITRLRALETARATAIASPNGISGMVDPSGRVLQRAPRRTQDVLEQELPLSTAITPAVRLGPWLGRGALLATAVMVGIAMVGGYRRRGTPTATTEGPLPVLVGSDR